MVVDMPKNTYNTKAQAFKNAKKIITKTRCNAVKLEGGKKIINIINYLLKKKINVVGHIGLLPQSISNPKIIEFWVKKKKIETKYIQTSSI